MNSQNKHKSKSRLVIIILILAVMIVAFFTNPNEQAHKEAIKAKSSEILKEVVSERIDGVGAVAWQLAGEQLLTGLINSNITVDNYYLFSVPKINWDGKSYPIGTGVFGKVYITKQLNRDVVQPILEDMEDKVKDSLPDILKQWF